MGKIGKVLSFGLIAAFVFLAMGKGALAMDHEVQKLTKEGVGSYLADAKGMTLYWFMKDSPGKSACAGPCVEKWPIYFRETVKAGEGLSDGEFGTTPRRGVGGLPEAAPVAPRPGPVFLKLPVNPDQPLLCTPDPPGGP